MKLTEKSRLKAIAMGAARLEKRQQPGGTLTNIEVARFLKSVRLLATQTEAFVEMNREQIEGDLLGVRIQFEEESEPVRPSLGEWAQHPTDYPPHRE